MTFFIKLIIFYSSSRYFFIFHHFFVILKEVKEKKTIIAMKSLCKVCKRFKISYASFGYFALLFLGTITKTTF